MRKLTKCEKIEEVKKQLDFYIWDIRNKSKVDKIKVLKNLKNFLLSKTDFKHLYPYLFKECICSGMTEIKEA